MTYCEHAELLLMSEGYRELWGRGAGREHKMERWAGSTSEKASYVTLGSVDFSLITGHNPRLREVTG